MACCPNCGRAQSPAKSIKALSRAERSELPKVLSRKTPAVELQIEHPFQVLFFSEKDDAWVKNPCLVRNPLTAYDLELRVVVCFVVQHLPQEWRERGLYSPSIRSSSEEVTQDIEAVISTCEYLMKTEQQKRLPKALNCDLMENNIKFRIGSRVHEILCFVNFNIAIIEWTFVSNEASCVGDIDVQNIVK
jgi:hypothetical protein